MNEEQRIQRIAELERALDEAHQRRIYWQELAGSRGRLLEARADEIRRLRAEASDGRR